MGKGKKRPRQLFQVEEPNFQPVVLGVPQSPMEHGELSVEEPSKEADPSEGPAKEAAPTEETTKDPDASEEPAKDPDASEESSKDPDASEEPAKEAAPADETTEEVIQEFLDPEVVEC